jgi:hypothetical protein
MAANKDLILSNIRKQLALNSGQLQVSSRGGAYQFADESGRPLSGSTNMTGYGASQAPGRYVTSMAAHTFSMAKGLFGGPNVPDEFIQVLANLATYYASQTGQPVQNLFKKGILLNDFLASINSIRDPSSQIGYVGINSSPNWARNPSMSATIANALGA